MKSLCHAANRWLLLLALLSPMGCKADSKGPEYVTPKRTGSPGAPFAHQLTFAESFEVRGKTPVTLFLDGLITLETELTQDPAEFILRYRSIEVSLRRTKGSKDADAAAVDTSPPVAQRVRIGRPVSEFKDLACAALIESALASQSADGYASLMTALSWCTKPAIHAALIYPTLADRSLKKGERWPAELILQAPIQDLSLTFEFKNKLDTIGADFFEFLSYSEPTATMAGRPFALDPARTAWTSRTKCRRDTGLTFERDGEFKIGFEMPGGSKEACAFSSWFKISTP